MKQSVPRSIKVRDMLIGFFSWAILSNLTFFLLLSYYLSLYSEDKLSKFLGSGRFSLGIWLFAIIIVFILNVKKRGWVSAGIGIEVVINTIIWIITLYSKGIMELLALDGLISFIGFPLPLGLIFVMMS